MAGKGGNLVMHLSDADGKRSVTSTGQQSEQEKQRQQPPHRQQEQERRGQDQDDISDDDDDATPKTTPREHEICFTGIEAVKVCHFKKKELEDLASYLRAKVTKEPSEGSPSKVTIRWDEKYSEDVTENVDKMKESLKVLYEEVVKLDVTKADAVRQLSKQYGDDSGVLIYISPMDFKVYVIADSYDKLSAALHRTKVNLGMITTSKRGGRSLENTDSSSGNKLYPDLSEASITENSDGYDHNRSRANMRDYKNRSDMTSWGNSSPSSSDSRSDFNRHRRGWDDNKYRQRDDGGQSSSSLNDDFEFQYDFPSGFRLKVYKASITNLKVDAIVNAANDNLVHGGGVARAISQAAGYKLDQESNDYVQANGFIEVGDNCLTTAGKLPYDKVIHAVGPQWHDYDDKKECLRDLYKTVYKVLMTSEKEKFKSVAMSAISAGIYAVPKELCADMYIQAVVDYAEKERRYPKELHIIDVDVSILKLVEKSVKKWEESPDSIKPSETLRHYMTDHPAATAGMGQGRGRRYDRQFSDPVSKPNENDEIAGLQVRKQSTVPLKWGGEDLIFSVNDSVKVHIYKGSIDKVINVRAVVCSTDISFGTTGYISKAFQDAFGEKYRNNFNKMKAKANYNATLGYVYTCETGSVYAPYVMHLAMKSLLTGKNQELQDYKMGLFNLFNKAEKRQFGEIALPLLGTGNVQNKPVVLRSCCRCMLEALRDFCNQGSSKHLLEIHLVNNSGTVTQLMVDTFKEAECSSSKSYRKGPFVGSHSFHKAASFDVTEQKKSNGHSSEDFSPGSTRTYGSRSFSSSGSARLDSTSYHSSDKKTEEIKIGASGWSPSVKYQQSGFEEQPESKTSNSKRKGNLRIIQDN